MSTFVSEMIRNFEIFCIYWFSLGLKEGVLLVCCGFPGTVLPCRRDEAVGGSIFLPFELSSPLSYNLFSSSSAVWLSTHSGGKCWQGSNPPPTPNLRQMEIPEREGGKFQASLLEPSPG